MGLFSKPVVKSNVQKIADLERKIAQLRAGGLVSSAERLEKQLKQYKPEQNQKVKPLSPKEMKKQINGARAIGQAK